MPDGEHDLEEAIRVAAEDLPTSNERSQAPEAIPEDNSDADIIAASDALGVGLVRLPQFIQDALRDVERRSQDVAPDEPGYSASRTVSRSSSTTTEERPHEHNHLRASSMERSSPPPWRSPRYVESDTFLPGTARSTAMNAWQDRDSGRPVPRRQYVQGFAFPGRREGLNMHSPAMHSRFARSRRNSNPTDSVPLRRRSETGRADDQSSTTLGRRIALRTAVTDRSFRDSARPQQGAQPPGSSQSTLTDHLYPPRTISGSTSTSRSLHSVVPGTLGYARQRINELLDWDADESVISGLRPANVADDDADLPDLQSFSRSSSPGLVQPAEPINISPSASRSREEHLAAASQRMRDMQERLDYVQNALFNASTERISEILSSFPQDNIEGYPAARTVPVGDRYLTRDNVRWQIVEEGRGYRTRRRLNSNGEEHVHRIRMDGWWAEDEINAGRSREPFDELESEQHNLPRPRNAQPTSRNISARTGASRREPPSAIQALFREELGAWRTGQPLLNADGDPVSDDENAAESLRNAGHPYDFRSRLLSDPTRTRLEFLPSTSRDMPDFDIEEIEVGSREENDTEKRFLGTSEPYYLCPLPVPLERPYLPRRPRPTFPIVSLESKLAAR